MTEALLINIVYSLAAGLLAVALTVSVMKLFVVGAIPGMIDEEWRGHHGVTKTDALVLGSSAAIMTFALANSFGTGIDTLLFAMLAAFGIAISYTDLLDFIIFNIVVYPMYLFIAISLVLFWHVNDLDNSFLIGAAIGAVVSYVIYLGQWYVSGLVYGSTGQLGFGDVRLSAPLGAIAGAFGGGVVLAAIFAANVIALLTIIVSGILQTGDRETKAQIAFGPFMIFGLVLALFLREPISEWWDTNTQAVVWLFGEITG